MGADSLINLHTHTRFSDGDYTPEQIAAVAERNHLTHVAITDHFETAKVRSLLKGDFETYLGMIREAQRNHRGVEVLAGVEIDTNPKRCDLDALPVDLLNRLDLVLFEYVGEREGSTLEQLEPLISQLKVPCGLAHCDIERVFGHLRPERAARYLASFDVFVEVNTAWPYKRDGVPFYERAERYYEEFRGVVPVSVGTDVHHSLGEVHNLEVPYRFVRRAGLERDTLF